MYCRRAMAIVRRLDCSIAGYTYLCNDDSLILPLRLEHVQLDAMAKANVKRQDKSPGSAAYFALTNRINNYPHIQ
jgi:hypothetical protein